MNAMPNHTILGRALNIYRTEMRNFIWSRLQTRLAKYGLSREEYIQKLLEESPMQTQTDRFADNLKLAIDIGKFSLIIIRNRKIFADRFPDGSVQKYLNPIKDIRNIWAHPDDCDIDIEDAISYIKQIEEALNYIKRSAAQSEAEALRYELEASDRVFLKNIEQAASWMIDDNWLDRRPNCGVLWKAFEIYRSPMRVYLRGRKIAAMARSDSFEDIVRRALPAVHRSKYNHVLQNNGGKSTTAVDIISFPLIIQSYQWGAFAQIPGGNQELLNNADLIRSALSDLIHANEDLDAEQVRGYITLIERSLEIIGANAKTARDNVKDLRIKAYPLQDESEKINLDDYDAEEEGTYIDLSLDDSQPVDNARIDENSDRKNLWDALNIFSKRMRTFIIKRTKHNGKFETLVREKLHSEASAKFDQILRENRGGLPLNIEIEVFSELIQFHWNDTFKDIFQQNEQEILWRLDSIQYARNKSLNLQGGLDPEDMRMNLTGIARVLELIKSHKEKDQIIALRDQEYPPQALAAKENPFSNLDLAQLETRASGCEDCALHNCRKNVVFGEGNPDADIMIVGHIPMTGADITGSPFIEDSQKGIREVNYNERRIGQYLTRMLTEIGLRRSDVYTTYMVKCKQSGIIKAGQREANKCRPYLLRQIEEVNPKLIVTLGQEPAKALIDTASPFSDIVGDLHEFEGFPVMPIQTTTSKDKTDQAIQILTDLREELGI